MTIHELIEKSGYSRRTIYYYTQIGLLPPPKGKGKNFRYEEEHLRRLQRIKELQMARLSLREIQEVLEHEQLRNTETDKPLFAERDVRPLGFSSAPQPRAFLAAETVLRITLAPGLELQAKWPLTREARDYLIHHLPGILKKLEE